MKFRPKYSWVALIATLIMWAPNTLWALGLGEVELESYLNEPLRFTIYIEQQTKKPATAEQIDIRLAGPQVYAQRGIEYPQFLEGLLLQVIGSDRLRIEGSSLQRLREPVVDFIFSVQWPGGSALVERTVIVDVSAEYQSNLEEQVANDIAQSEVVIRQPVKKVASEESPSTSPKVLPLVGLEQGGERSENTDYVLHTVKKGEVLSLVASEYRGEVDIPLHRYMRAIKQVNLQSFPEGLDQLSPGQKIRMPDPMALLDASLDHLPLPVHAGQPLITYQVQYGDKLSILAQRFRGNVDMPLKDYIRHIVDVNQGQLDVSGASLKSGMTINIPNPDLLVGIPLSPVQNLEVVSVADEVLEPVVSLEFQEQYAPSLTPAEEGEGIEETHITNDNKPDSELVDSGWSAIPVDEESLPDVSAFMDKPVEREVEAVSESSLVKVKPEPVTEPINEGYVDVAVENTETSDSFPMWVLYILGVVLGLLALFVLFLVAKRSGKEPELPGIEPLPSLIPEEEEHEEGEEEAEKEYLKHEMTLRLDASEYLEEAQGQGPADYNSADQNEVEKLILDGQLSDAEKKADQLIYSQPGTLKNWLLKLEVLAKQEKKERCFTLAAQVRGSFQQAHEYDAINSVLQKYFPGEVSAEDFVPGELIEPQKNAAIDLAADLSEAKVYLSYGFYDMAQQILDRLLNDHPRHVEAHILALEVKLGQGEKQVMQQKADELLDGRINLSPAQRQQIEDLKERAGNFEVDEPKEKPDMDLDLSEPESSESVSPVIDLELDIDDIGHLDAAELHLDEEIEEALHREEEAQHKLEEENQVIELDKD